MASPSIAVSAALTRLTRLARDRAYFGALLAALPVLIVIAALSPAVFVPHLPAIHVALVMILIAPLLEEIVFRAGLQDLLATRLRQRMAGLSLANILTALVFATMHLIRHPAPWALATAVPALVFGFFYERHRSLAAPIGLHASYNAAYLILLS